MRTCVGRACIGGACTDNTCVRVADAGDDFSAQHAYVKDTFIGGACTKDIYIGDGYCWGYYQAFGNLFAIFSNLGRRRHWIENPSRNWLNVIIPVVDIILADIYCSHYESGKRWIALSRDLLSRLLWFRRLIYI